MADFVGTERLHQVQKEVKRILLYVYLSSQKKLEKKQGFFELFGCDILLDENLKPHLLEINTNPAIFLDT